MKNEPEQNMKMKTENEIREALRSLRLRSVNNQKDREARNKLIAVLEWVLGKSLPLLDNSEPAVKAESEAA